MHRSLEAIRAFVWGERPSTKKERILLLKLDWFILSYCCLMYFSNYLDRSNITNAYVSGMKEELNMQGTDFNKINTIFTCGYIVGMIPNNLALQVFPPRIWFPCMQIIWGVLTFSTSAVHNVQSIYGIRFLQGLAESSTFVGTHYILGSWYKPAELGKRSGIFTASGLVGTLFSGVLQAAVYKHLNGIAGRSGWRWLFIIDGIITLPIALYGFVVFPDVPASTKAFYLSNEEKVLSYERLDSSTDVKKHKITWNLLRRVLSKWRWYGCSLLFAISGETESLGSNNIMGQFLKATGGYTVEQIDYYPSGATAFAIASTLVCATWTDYSGGRWVVLVYMATCCIIAGICLLVHSSPIGLKFFAFYLAGASYAGQATTFAWANEICADDNQVRGIVLASMNMWNNVINAWWSIVFYPATDAPNFTKGMIALISVSVATLVITFAVLWLANRDLRENSTRSLRNDSEKPSMEGTQEVGSNEEHQRVHTDQKTREKEDQPTLA